MLSNFNFGGGWWGNEDGRVVNLSSLIRDEEEKDLEGNVHDLDELADRLLTQFPPYGTNHNHVGSQNDEDWLLSEGDEDTPTQEEIHNANRHPGLVSVALPSPATSNKTLIPLPASNTNDWDYDEQCLWKPENDEEEKMNEHLRRGNSGNAVKNLPGTNLEGGSFSSSQKQSRDRRQQWIYGKNAHCNQETSTGNMINANQDPGKPHQQQQRLQQKPGPNSGTSNDNSYNNFQDFYNSRQHWMPDQLCKHCYSCDTPFTVFRRRHHCRLCGQVFCSSCSAYFVPSQKKGTSTLRTCRMCYEQVTEKGGLLGDNDEDVSPGIENGSNNNSNNNIVQVNDANNNKTGPYGKVDDSNPKDGEQRYPGKPETKTATPLSPKHKHNHDDSEQTQQRETTGNADSAAAAPVVSMGQEANQEVQLPPEAHWREALHQEDEAKDIVKEAKRHLGLIAANHLEKMGEDLLDKDAPLLWQEVCKGNKQDVRIRKQWLHKIMTLATRCCATVEPNVKKGDLLDIRPYVKIKVIPGGSLSDCAYLSGIVFRKTVSHKRMAKEIRNPKIMLLSGGIEFTRTENRIASLHTLLEQEGKYMEILVGRILKLQPDVLCVGRSVSRRALELLLKANVVLVQHVKSTLMSRISRQTGATIISSTDHIMNQFGAHVLGKCNRFRLVTFRDNEIWIDPMDSDSDIDAPETTDVENPQQRSIRGLLRKQDLSNHERQAVLAANMLGHGVVDGAEAVKCGLAKRGVAQTYVMLEGCPKDLGCTVVLRGASRGALKQVKRVFRFLVNVAYNLRLETCYLKERCARICPDFQVEPKHIYSSSLCVEYGSPPVGRKVVRPWNGGNETAQRSISGEITAFDHQSILITSVWMTDKTQCCPAEVKGICYYSLQDVSLGQFLRDSCFNLSLKCQNPACKKSVDDHSLLFVHNDGMINITVEHVDNPLPPPPSEDKRKAEGGIELDGDSDVTDQPIATWTFCKQCNKVVTPLVYISENTWKFSFGKFLEVFFYNHDAIMNSAENKCSCTMQTDTLLYFGCGKLAARFAYERVRPLGVFVRKNLPIDISFHRKEALTELERISMASSKLFVKFDKHIDKVAREARSLFGSAANRPEHLQTVLSELNRIGSEVDHAALTLQEKIASVSDKCRREEEGPVNEALLCFPWFSRRYLYMLTSAWNERLSAAGQAIVAMKKLASSAALRGESVIGPNGPAGTEELLDGMRRLRQLNEVYSRYNVGDINTVLPTIPGNDNQQDPEYDDDFEDVDASIDFADGVDADVLASRRRLNNNSRSLSMGTSSGYSSNQYDQSQNQRRQLHKSLGTQRSFDSSQLQQEATNSSQPRVTPGGAVKSAITRFFNRGGRDTDPYLVDLGIFKDGRPRLEPGVNGIVVPIEDEQLCTVIGYSLASSEYARQFKNFSKMEHLNTELDEAGRPIEQRLVDPSTGAHLPSPASQAAATGTSTKPGGATDEKKSIEQRMLVRNKSHIKHTFRDHDEKGQVTCKFVCTTYWATQFNAVRQVFLSSTFGKKDAASTGDTSESSFDVEQGYIQSLSAAYSWAASGGKSGASFARTADDRFVIKCISRTELQMFLDCAPAYFEYLSKAAFHGLPTVLCKIVGVYQIGYHNRETGKRSMEQVAVMQNIFYKRKISRVFDLKGSLRGRFAAQVQHSKEESRPSSPTPETAASGNYSRGSSATEQGNRSDGKVVIGSDKETTDDNLSNSSRMAMGGTQLDGDFLEFTQGRPMPLNDRAKSLFHMSIQNDTLFLSIINVLDYSILVGIDEENTELVVGIIDFMRQYDILKQMERVGKSLPMVVGSEAPTIIQPPLYKARFTNAMERYFMTVPCKWTTISS